MLLSFCYFLKLYEILLKDNYRILRVSCLCCMVRITYVLLFLYVCFREPPACMSSVKVECHDANTESSSHELIFPDLKFNYLNQSDLDIDIAPK